MILKLQPLDVMALEHSLDFECILNDAATVLKIVFFHRHKESFLLRHLAYIHSDRLHPNAVMTVVFAESQIILPLDVNFHGSKLIVAKFLEDVLTSTQLLVQFIKLQFATACHTATTYLLKVFKQC